MLKGRTNFLRISVLFVLVVLTGRIFWVQSVKASENLRRGEATRLDKRPVEPVRGAIMDRNGRYFAISVVSHTVVANLLQMPDPKNQQDAAEKLSPLIGMSAQDILAKFSQNPKAGWLPLKAGLDLKQAQAVKDLQLAGITLEEHLNRTYPQGMTANQTIGYLDAKGQGQYGLEARYDKELAGVPGSVTAEFTDQGTPIENTIVQSVPSVAGRSLVLSLDIGLQQFVEQKLEQVVKENDAKRGLVLAMDVHTGEILVMAERPGADPGNRTTWGDPVDFNRINNWAVEPMSPGSSFKPITTSIALEEHDIDLNTPFIDKGEIVRSGVRITNWDGDFPVDPAPQTIARLLQRSSNVGLIQVGEKIPRDTFVKYMNAFGLMEKTGIDLSTEQDSIFGSPFKDKTDVDWANMYIGQHLMVTPLQLIRAEAAIANGGYLVQPHIVREMRDPDGKVVWTAPTVKGRQVISEATAQEVRDLMVSVVEKGSATLANSPPTGYIVAGKTGTAQKFENGKMKDRNLADFMGIVPANNPQVIMLVMIDEPKGLGYGGMIAAPLFHDIMPTVMRSVGVMPNTPAALGTEKAPPKVVAGTVPNVLWLPTAQAQERLAAAGYTVKLDGTGDVVSAQSLKPGSTARSGTEIGLTLAPRPTDGTVRVPDFSGLSLTEAGQLADAVGLTLKASGSGFVASQDQEVGAAVPVRSTFSVRLAPR